MANKQAALHRSMPAFHRPGGAVSIAIARPFLHSGCVERTDSTTLSIDPSCNPIVWKVVSHTCLWTSLNILHNTALTSNGNQKCSNQKALSCLHFEIGRGCRILINTGKVILLFFFFFSFDCSFNLYESFVLGLDVSVRYNCNHCSLIWMADLISRILALLFHCPWI